jgi:hypothetical protein
MAVPTAILVAEYTEIESGKRSDRPQLQAALATCKRHKATLIIAKLLVNKRIFKALRRINPAFTVPRLQTPGWRPEK